MFCRRCDYELSGLPAGMCPECGGAFDPADDETVSPHPGAARRGIRILIAVLAVLGLLLPGETLFGSGAPATIVFMTTMPLALALAATLWGLSLHRGRISRPILAAALVPGTLTLVLFYSLALHMWLFFGGWPANIGTGGFSPILEWHAEIAMDAFGGLLLFTVFGWCWITILCAAVPSWRRTVVHLGVLALASVACFGLMLMAPDGFLYWWWD